VVLAAEMRGTAAPVAGIQGAGVCGIVGVPTSAASVCGGCGCKSPAVWHAWLAASFEGDSRPALRLLGCMVESASELHQSDVEELVSGASNGSKSLDSIGEDSSCMPSARRGSDSAGSRALGGGF
jgi:hypothetical protein